MFRFDPRVGGVALATALLCLGCGDWPWPMDRAIDPGRCDPRCSSGRRCVEGACVGLDTGVFDADLTPGDGPRLDRAPVDRGLTDRSTDLPRTYDLRLPDRGSPCAGLTCPLGCNTPLGRCNRLVASNVHPRPFHDMATSVLKLAAGSTVVFHTDTGQITNGAVVVRPPNTPGAYQGMFWNTFAQSTAGQRKIAVFAFGSLTVSGGATARVNGTLPVLFYATGSISVAGTLSTLPSGSTPGAGGYAGGGFGGSATACFGGEAKVGAQKTPGWRNGGGGGGRGGNGGNGGYNSRLMYLWPGGPAKGSPSLFPLYGGCGGAGGFNAKYGGYGGGGGGAI